MAGSIAISATQTAANVNLTSLGAEDWAAWTNNETPTNRKLGGGSLISSVTPIIAGTDNYSGQPKVISWTDGTPTASGNITGGVYFSAISGGFSFTVPAGIGARTVKIYHGLYATVAKLTASLSDGSASPEVYNFPSSGGYSAYFTEVTFNANSASQTLTLEFINVSGSDGNVALQAVHLSAESAGITGSANITTADDLSTASGTSTVTGSLSLTTSNDTSTATGTTLIFGSVAVTTANDVSTASGSVGGTITGSANITTADDVSSTSGTITILGNANVTTGNDASTANGFTGAITGTVNVTTGNDTSNAQGSTPDLTSLFGGSGHFKNLNEQNKKNNAKRQLKALETQDNVEYDAVTQDVVVIAPKVVKKRIIENIITADDRELIQSQLRDEMIKEYLLIVQAKQQEEEQAIVMMMLALI